MPVLHRPFRATGDGASRAWPMEATPAEAERPSAPASPPFWELERLIAAGHSADVALAILASRQARQRRSRRETAPAAVS